MQPTLDHSMALSINGFETIAHRSLIVIPYSDARSMQMNQHPAIYLYSLNISMSIVLCSSNAFIDTSKE